MCLGIDSYTESGDFVYFLKISGAAFFHHKVLLFFLVLNRHVRRKNQGGAFPRPFVLLFSISMSVFSQLLPESAFGFKFRFGRGQLHECMSIWSI
jgi:hypothetical protein